VELWGIDAQTLQVAEEAAELTEALCHLRRGKCDGDKVIDEIADNYLSLFTCIALLKVQSEDSWTVIEKKIADRVTFKTDRLTSRLSKQDQNA
jgi:NTP pyrophosphatase (non-canonical NTP hydrolase)